MGVQKSKVASVHKYTRFFVKLNKQKKKKLKNDFYFFKYFINYAHLVNLLLEYLLVLKFTSFFSFFCEAVIIYNLIQIFKQTNIYYILAYFLTFIIFIGFSLIFNDLDLGVIILWFIYGGVVIIFFLYATMWTETIKFNIYFIDFKLSFIIFYFFCLYNVIEVVEFVDSIGWYVSIYTSYLSAYNYLVFDKYSELEILGYSFFFFSLFYLIICTIVLVMSCLCIVIISISLKRFKVQSFLNYLEFIHKFTKYYSFIILKNQNFSVQEYDNSFMYYSKRKVFKISTKFHRYKVEYRRI